MKNTYAASLIRKHRRKGILVDTNLLLLFVVGLADSEYISKTKRTGNFTPDDFELLLSILKNFETIVTTPNVLTEVSNLLAQTDESKKAECFEVFVQKIGIFSEVYVDSFGAVRTLAFEKLLGLTDSTISVVAEDSPLVLTADLPLYHFLINTGRDAINFNHLRSF